MLHNPLQEHIIDYIVDFYAENNYIISYVNFFNYF